MIYRQLERGEEIKEGDFVIANNNIIKVEKFGDKVGGLLYLRPLDSEELTEQIERKDNISSFEAVYLAMKNPDLEIGWGDLSHWVTYGEFISTSRYESMGLSSGKSWSIRKRKNNIDKALLELEESFVYKSKHHQSASGQKIREILTKHFGEK